MAVYTQLSAEALAALIACYDVGELVSAKGIAEGVSNSNWLVDTTGSDGPKQDGRGARYILTMYERRIDLDDLPFFLSLLDHLAARGCPVPRTIHDREGALYRKIGEKCVALIEFLPGVSVGEPTPAQARAVGAALAQMHLAAADFAGSRHNDLGIATSADVLAACGAERLAAIDPDLPRTIGIAAELARNWPQGLPTAVIHSDLFPDNVLMRGNEVSALIDFYFACTDAEAYDLAVTHAAWCFSADGRTFNPAVGDALLAGYASVRPLTAEERTALPVLAEGACLRFVSSRAQDWLDTPADALVARKDPMAFVRRLDHYRTAGAAVFASA